MFSRLAARFPLRKCAVMGVALWLPLSSLSVAEYESASEEPLRITDHGRVAEILPRTAVLPERLVLKEITGPVTYRISKRISFTRQDGSALNEDEGRAQLKVGSVVRVHFADEAEGRTIHRVEIDDRAW